MKIYSIANQKGGVGKTTTAVNLTASLAQLGKRVLLLDLDPQANATLSCTEIEEVSSSSYQVLMGQLTVAQARLTLAPFGFDLVAGSSDLTAAELDLLKLDNRESRLKAALSLVVNDYDYIFIDCPPAINLLTLNALVACEAVLIPMQCEYFSLEGITRLVDTIATLRQSLNPQLSIAGVVRTMYDPRATLATDVSDKIIQEFGSSVFETTIPRNIRLAEAPSHGMPCLFYDKSSRGALAYLALASEMIQLNNSSAQLAQHN